jgi:perosamine synthetase
MLVVGLAALDPPYLSNQMLPYSRPSISDDDIQAVVEVLQSDWLTTGPMIERFERAAADYVGAAEAVAVSSGTAALHAAVFALRIGPGDEVIVPAMTFVATANCVVYQGATPVFADVDPDTLLIDPARAEARISPRTRAIIGVDYAGQPCDTMRLGAIARKHGLALVADASHSLGASDRGVRSGKLADLSTFSLHPVKPITAGEGGLLVTDDAEFAGRARRFRNHGMTTDHRQRASAGSWHYAMTELGYNYRLTDLQAALGLSQLARLDGWIARRQAIAARYDRAFARLPGVRPLGVRPGVCHGRHLYVVRLGTPHAPREAVRHAEPDEYKAGVAAGANTHRNAVFAALRAVQIATAVHYVPVHLHPFYRERFGTGPGLCPVAEAAYEEILSLPIFPAMTDEDVDRVIAAMEHLHS